jgi:putative selenate reductase molybdopterin-binding subunit
MEKIARALNLDPIEFRLKNCIRPGEYHPFSTAWNEGRKPRPEIIHTVGIEQCVAQGKAAIDWDSKYGNATWHLGDPSSRTERASTHPQPSVIRKGIGMLGMQGLPFLSGWVQLP